MAETPDDTYTAPIGCGRYDCTTCGEKKAKRLHNELYAGFMKAKGDNPWMLITLTEQAFSERQKAPLEERLATHRSFVRTLQKAYQYEFGHPLQFIAVQELTKRKVWHTHMVAVETHGRTRVAFTAWLRRQWLKITGDSYIVDVRGKQGADRLGAGTAVKAVHYVLKYVTKDIGGLSGTRRFTKSNGIERPHLGVLDTFAMYDRDTGSKSESEFFNVKRWRRYQAVIRYYERQGRGLPLKWLVQYKEYMDHRLRRYTQYFFGKRDQWNEWVDSATKTWYVQWGDGALEKVK